MKKIICLSILFVFMYEIIVNINIVFDSINYSFNIWKNSIFPSLFPFLIISNLLIQNGILEIIDKYLNKTFKKLFNINTPSIFIFLMSMLSGFPSSSKYIKELYNSKNIEIEDARKIILFSHFSNPMFIIGTISITFLKSKNMGFIILISHYISNILLGLIYRNKKISNNNYKYRPINKSFSTIIIDSINTLFVILGNVAIFSIITSIISTKFNIDYCIKGIIFGTLEITQGIKYISISNISINLKTAIISSMLSFGGLSIHMQTFSIIDNIDIKYRDYLISRILHSIISFIISFIIIKTVL